MTSAFDLIGRSPALQEHWFRRVVALVVDAVIIFVIGYFVDVQFGIFAWPFLAWVTLLGAVWVVYGVALEGGIGATIGKRLVHLHVQGIDTEVGAKKALVRNASKINPVVLLLDFLLGFATSGDPRQRYLDRFSRTSVVRVDPHAYIEEQFRAMQHQPPQPTPPAAAAWGQPTPAATPEAATVATSPAAGGWPGQTPPAPGSGWPKHEWDETGTLRPRSDSCGNCGGQLVARGDEKLVCVKCGLVY